MVHVPLTATSRPRPADGVQPLRRQQDRRRHSVERVHLRVRLLRLGVVAARLVRTDHHVVARAPGLAHDRLKPAGPPPGPTAARRSAAFLRWKARGRWLRPRARAAESTRAPVTPSMSGESAFGPARAAHGIAEITDDDERREQPHGREPSRSPAAWTRPLCWPGPRRPARARCRDRRSYPPGCTSRARSWLWAYSRISESLTSLTLPCTSAPLAGEREAEHGRLVARIAQLDLLLQDRRRPCPRPRA